MKRKALPLLFLLLFVSIPTPSESGSPADNIELTPAEKAWLKDHKNIRLGFAPNWPPFDFVDSTGAQTGMSSDYVRILNERLGLNMEAVPDRTWSEVLTRAKDREIDVTSGTLKTSRREAYLLFTIPYISSVSVIITRKNTPLIGGLGDLYGKKVAVVRDYWTHDNLKRDHPAIDLYLADSVPDGLKAVSDSKADAFVDNLLVSAYMIQKWNLLDLKIAAPTSFEEDKLRFGVRSDWPELVGILNKGLRSITPLEHEAIRKKWFPIRFDHVCDSSYLWELILKVGSVLLVLLGLVVVWNLKTRRREERFRGLTEKSLDITQALSPEGRIVYQSPSHESMLGYGPGELIGESAFDLFCEEDKPQLKQILRELDHGDGIGAFEHRLRHKDGHLLHFESNCVNLLHNKALKAFVIHARDVTQRKETAAKLRAELSKFQALYDLAVAMTAEHSLDRNLSLVVEKSRELLGTDTSFIALRDEAAGDVYMHTMSGIKTEAAKKLRIPFGQGLGGKVAKTGKPHIVEDYFQEVGPLLHDETRAEGIISGIAVPVQMGQMNLGVLYVFNRTKTSFSKRELDTLSLLGNMAAVEITRKRAQEALRQSQDEFRILYEESHRASELYRTLLDASADPIAVYDIEGIPMYLNPAFTRVFGWTFKEVAGKTIDFVPPEDWPETEKYINKVLRGESFSGFETRRYTKDGRVLDVSLSAAIFFSTDGRAAGSVIQLRDITERKRLEERLRQAAKMEAIGNLAGGVAHDFNNLLTAMMGYSNMLLQEMPEDSLHREKVVQIARAAERAAELTRQLLAFSRKQVLELKVLDLNLIIADFAKILRRLVGEHVEIVTRFDPSLGRVKADPSQIEQILMNLAVNARDAMPRGGKLTMETRNEVLDQEYARTQTEVCPGEYVMVSVTDTGIGMDPDTVSRIFDPFFTTKEKGRGTGLGLSTVYGIVKQHRGHVAVCSEPGLRTVFKVYLPLVHEPLEEASEAPKTQPQLGGQETILLVEDEEIVAKLSCEALEMLGYIVLAASNPEQALDLCRQHEGKIHLVLTDVDLPQMDGRSLFKRLSQQRPNMRVLYMSGYAQEVIFQHGVLEAGVHFLQKPFSVVKLAAKVRAILDKPERLTG